MIDSAGRELENTAHAYMECANKGLCDRQTGQCECFPGYEGVGCQRAGCPNACSGHGTCKSISQLARAEYDNLYKLWDKDMSYGCACDPGWDGPDCSLRLCKYGIDPLYSDEVPSRVAVSRFVMSSDITGTYALKFYDVFGEDWTTDPLSTTAATSCRDVVGALEALPNTIIKSDSVTCSKSSGSFGDPPVSLHGFSLTFTGNPGYLKELEMDTYLDGTRPTISKDENTEHAWSESTGEFVDFFATKCERVFARVKPIRDSTELRHIATYENPENVTFRTAILNNFTLRQGLGLYPTLFGNLNAYAVLDDLTSQEAALLKTCLGDADGNPDNNIQIYDWDTGAVEYLGNYQEWDTWAMSGTPHVVKLTKANPANSFDGGRFALLWFNPFDSAFYVATKLNDTQAEYSISTTDGTAERIFHDEDADGKYNLSEPAVTAFFTIFDNMLYTSMDTACESADAKIRPCLRKGDRIFIADANWGRKSQRYFHTRNDKHIRNQRHVATVPSCSVCFLSLTQARRSPICAKAIP